MRGSHKKGRCDSNGEIFLALCSEYNPAVTNTFFKHKSAHKTWIQPWHKLDYVIVRQKDHVMLRCRLKIHKRRRHCKTGTEQPSEADTQALQGEDLVSELNKNIKQ